MQTTFACRGVPANICFSGIIIKVCNQYQMNKNQRIHGTPDMGPDKKGRANVRSALYRDRSIRIWSLLHFTHGVLLDEVSQQTDLVGRQLFEFDITSPSVGGGHGIPADYHIIDDLTRHPVHTKSGFNLKDF